MRALSVLFALMLAALNVCAAGIEIITSTPQSVTVRRFDGVETVVPKSPKRVVIGYASAAQPWYLAGGTAIAVPTLANKTLLPEAARELPEVGALGSLNTELIVSMKPDLVLLNAKHPSHVRLSGILADMGVAALALEYDHYDDFVRLGEIFSAIVGTDGGGEMAALMQRVEAITTAAAELASPKCVIVFAAAAGFSVESDRTNTGTIVKMLGGDNLAAEACGGSARAGFSLEQLMVYDPEVIVVVPMGRAAELKAKFEKEMAAQSVWQALQAAKNNRVHFLPADLFLYVPGERFPEAFAYMAELLYPGIELNGDVEMKEYSVLAAWFGSTIPRATASYDLVERAIAENTGAEVERAYLSGIVRKRLDYKVDDVTGALEKLREKGVRRVKVLAGVLTAGEEYDRLVAMVDEFRKSGAFESIEVTSPPLASQESIARFAAAVGESLTELPTVFMGHGHSDGRSDAVYRTLTEELKKHGEVYLACVEGEVVFEDILAELKANDVREVVLRPFMLVAGDHALNDLAGEEDGSWKSLLEGAGIECRLELKGLGEYPQIIKFFADML